MRTYAIGDIHGHLDKLKDAHRLIEADREATGDRVSPVVHLGDLVDRGPNSAGVIDYLIDGMAQSSNWVVLRGNHDRLFELFLRREKEASGWLSPVMGGMATLNSYGVRENSRMDHLYREAEDKVPPEHISFIEALPLTFERGECLFVHAGIRPGVPIPDQEESVLLGIRGEFLSSTEDHGPLIVHGHSMVDEATHYGNRLALDTGAGRGDGLTAAVIEGREAWVLEKSGRRKLDPPG